MNEVINSGRTILLVTHSMEMITKLCQHAMLIRNGLLEKIGAAPEVVDYYQVTSESHVEAT